MSDNKNSKLSQRINRLRWLAPVFAFLLVLSHQILEHTWLVDLPRWPHFATQLFFYGLLGPLLDWWALTSLCPRLALSDPDYPGNCVAGISEHPIAAGTRSQNRLHPV